MKDGNNWPNYFIDDFDSVLTFAERWLQANDCAAETRKLVWLALALHGNTVN